MTSKGDLEALGVQRAWTFVHYAEDVFDLEYIGDAEQAAPQLHAARLDSVELADAFNQLVSGLQCLTSEGFVHGDLSSYNLLWWHGRLWFIDFPQAIDLAANLQGLEFLDRDLANVCTGFNARASTPTPTKSSPNYSATRDDP